MGRPTQGRPVAPTGCDGVAHEGRAPAAVWAAFGVDRKTVTTWTFRFDADGPVSLEARFYKSEQLAALTPAETVEQILDLRRSPARRADRSRDLCLALDREA